MKESLEKSFGNQILDISISLLKNLDNGKEKFCLDIIGNLIVYECVVIEQIINFQLFFKIICERVDNLNCSRYLWILSLILIKLDMIDIEMNIILIKKIINIFLYPKDYSIGIEVIFALSNYLLSNDPFSLFDLKVWDQVIHHAFTNLEHKICFVAHEVYGLLTIINVILMKSKIEIDDFEKNQFKEILNKIYFDIKSEKEIESLIKNILNQLN